LVLYPKSPMTPWISTFVLEKPYNTEIVLFDCEKDLVLKVTSVKSINLNFTGMVKVEWSIVN